MIKSININKGVLIFYIVIALLSLLCVFRMNNLNVVGNNSSNDSYETYCA